MKSRFSTFTAFFLFALMFFKVISFHVYSHEDSTSDEIENCEICDAAVENQNLEYLVPTSQISTTSNVVFYTEKPTINYESVVIASYLRADFFGRPPPSIS